MNDDDYIDEDEDEDEDDEFPVGTILGKTLWVIPHWSSLDYCAVRVVSEADGHGRVRVEGYRSHGWTPDGAKIKTRVPADRLTETPSWHNDFKMLYDDPCNPRNRNP